MVVASLSEIDPKAALEAIRTPQGSITAETEFKEVKLRTANGTEVPARVVLKDPDTGPRLHCAHGGRPGRQNAVLASASWTTKRNPVLGSYYLVLRAPKVVQRVPLVQLGTVEAIAEKPRRLFMVYTKRRHRFAGYSTTASHLLGICLRHTPVAAPSRIP